MEVLKNTWSWFYDVVLTKPLSGWITVIFLAIYFFVWLQPQQNEDQQISYNLGFAAGKKESLDISKKDSMRIDELKAEKAIIQNKLDSTDCEKNLKRSIDLFASLKKQVIASNNEKQENLKTIKTVNSRLESKLNQYVNR